ncbi:hypothetical protein [Ferrimonas marina]|uniref:Uncharacterized protein n=1 Tax=Ferrimonas marina TaxID=299255 RepID=A0A1M5TNJ3_9GAMM|nr:hypothetical protein [Ferrimonas marina]SHH52258.1 hypothetical protein SAMN02745129_2215 [Ferrimonas marina]
MRVSEFQIVGATALLVALLNMVINAGVLYVAYGLFAWLRPEELPELSFLQAWLLCLVGGALMARYSVSLKVGMG